MENISGYGIRGQLLASNTFPAGFSITEFADDSDPLDVPSLQINDKSMGINGDLLTWSKANPLAININVIPNGADDINLSILLEANRVAKNKISSRDNITLVLSYPDGHIVTLSQGTITDGTFISPVQSSGRLKSKNYSFAFENVIKV